MSNIRYIKSNYVKVESLNDKMETVLFWGDRVELLGAPATGKATIRFSHRVEEKDGSIVYSNDMAIVDESHLEERSEVLKVNFVDVQQGDGTIVESPPDADHETSIILIDGGENQLFARYLASRFRKHTKMDPQIVDYVVLSHGDSDHINGLIAIAESQTNDRIQKRLFMFPETIYHSGIAKRAKPASADQVFGPVVSFNNLKYLPASSLVTDYLSLGNTALATTYVKWIDAIKAWQKNKPNQTITCKNLSFPCANAFPKFTNKHDDISIEVLGPIPENCGNGQQGYRWYRNKPGPTINGNSVVLKLKYGDVSFLFTGDLNEDSAQLLVEKHGSGLSSQVLKVPHHGSADYNIDFLEKVKPVVSVISSGDDNVKQEHIHPRACLVGGLGKHSSADMPLVFVTELSAFFGNVGTSLKLGDDFERYYGFKRQAFGMIRIRTDGEKILAITDSAKPGAKEKYLATKVSGNWHVKKL